MELLLCPHCNVDSIGMEYSRSIFAGQTYASHSNSDGWKARCDGCGNQTAWWHTEHLARKAWNTRPAPSEHPSEAVVVWTEEEHHAIAHARHQVEQASPEKPDCCFDFDLVKDLLRVIDRSSTLASERKE